MKISQADQKLAMVIKLAMRAGNEPNYKAGIWAVAREYAESEIPGSMQNLFYMLCGYHPHDLPSK